MKSLEIKVGDMVADENNRKGIVTDVIGYNRPDGTFHLDGISAQPYYEGNPIETPKGITILPTNFKYDELMGNFYGHWMDENQIGWDFRRIRKLNVEE